MAREHARIMSRIWSDRDWRDLPPESQRLYFLLLSQGTLTQAGVLPLQVRKWAKGSKATSERDIQQALDTLKAARFVVVDEDTEEVLIRSFIRNDGVTKIPNVFKAALKAATAVESPTLRDALARELRRTRREQASAVADELSATDSRTDPEPIENQSGSALITNREPLKVRNGMPKPRGEGVGEGEGESPTVGGYVGEDAPARSPVTDDRPTTWQAPPSRCPQHRDTENPPPCVACRNARTARERWDEQRAAELAERLANARADPQLRCEHGTDAGRYIRPDTGDSPCPFCRKTAQDKHHA